ncbi:hypothetical protein [Thioalkalivibrio sp. ALJT]|uniref:hypothetical protein n=1 Tax=Thioalkalivibrio sp. ALJT TaxID=1158146 RepID=UPI0004757B6A|nr:hypothetical protein [Thioalkalivibrio sp. ALJT]
MRLKHLARPLFVMALVLPLTSGCTVIGATTAATSAAVSVTTSTVKATGRTAAAVGRTITPSGKDDEEE